MLYAAHFGDAASVQALLAAKADPNLTNRYGFAPMHEAALRADAAMLRTLSRPAIEAGRAYAARGAVRRLAASADGRVIEAEVKGTATRPYSLRITLQRRRDGGTAFDGSCSCPVGFDCKHVAAALFAARGERGDVPRPAPPSAPVPTTAPDGPR